MAEGRTPTGSLERSSEQSTGQQAKRKAKETTTQAQKKAQETTQQVQEKAQETAQQVRGQAGNQLRQQVGTRSTQAGEQVASIADAIRRTGAQLRSEGSEGPAKVSEQAAERAERLGGYLRDSDADRILGDVESFARRQPWLLAGGGVVLGFFASRFLKASSSRRLQSLAGEGRAELPARTGDLGGDYGGYDRPLAADRPTVGTPAPTADVGLPATEPRSAPSPSVSGPGGAAEL
jgi:hypothetical protein